MRALPGMTCIREVVSVREEERMRGAFRDASQAWRKAYARVQLVMPSVVAIAVRMLMAI